MNDLTVYEQSKDTMKTGDLLLWASDSVLGVVIRAFSGDVNHASLIVRLSEYEGFERRRFTTEALENGIVLNLLSKRLKEFKGKVFWYPLIDDWDCHRTSIGERSLGWMGTGYDYSSLFINAIKHVEANPEKLFCSEYCFLSYGLVGEAPTPADMKEMGIFKEPVRIL